MIDGKKSSMLLVLKTLEEYSDEEHFLTQKAIIERIESDYGLTYERKSIADSLALLGELGYDIIKSPRGGFALYSRLFEPSEVQLLTDALFSFKGIPGKEAADLSKKAQSVLSSYSRRSYNYIHKTPKLSRTDSKEVFFAIDSIHEGIKKGKQISFQYKGYDEEGEEKLRYEGYRYIVSPYYLVSNNGFYYLLCHYKQKYQPLHIFRLDLLTNIQIEEEKDIRPIETVPGLEKFDIADYLNEHIYLLNGNSVDATLRIDRLRGIQYLKDWFGNKARIFKKGDEMRAYVKCNELAFYYWILQYGDDFTVLEPDYLIVWIKEFAARQLEKYGG